MEFNEKLQELRKQKNMTQEELAQVLFVSRTAVSKWESARGYPSIDSLKAISQFFSVSIDQLLSCDQVISIAQQDNIHTKQQYRDIVFGLLDTSAVLLFFLPLFRQNVADSVISTSLLTISGIQPYTKVLFIVSVLSVVLSGLVTLAFQHCRFSLWQKSKNTISLALNMLVSLIFILSLQPYPAVFLFVFLIIKTFILIKK